MALGAHMHPYSYMYCAPHRDGVLQKTPLAIDLDDACVKGGFYSATVDSPGRISDLGDHIQAEGKTNSSSRFSEMISVGLRFEAKGEDDTRARRSVRSEGNGMGNADGTRSVSLGSERHYLFESQEEKQPGSGKILGAVRESGPDVDSSRELGRPIGRPPGLGLDYRAALCPDSTNRPLINGLVLYEPTCFKTQDAVLENGSRQGLLSRSVETSDSLGPMANSPNAGQEGIALHYGEEDELSEVVVQEDGHNLKNRYGDNPYAQSTPIPFSIFCRPLLLGGFSGQGGSLPDKVLVPLRVVAADGRE